MKETNGWRITTRKITEEEGKKLDMEAEERKKNRNIFEHPLDGDVIKDIGENLVEYAKEREGKSAPEPFPIEKYTVDYHNAFAKFIKSKRENQNLVDLEIKFINRSRIKVQNRSDELEVGGCLEWLDKREKRIQTERWISFEKYPKLHEIFNEYPESIEWGRKIPFSGEIKKAIDESISERYGIEEGRIDKRLKARFAKREWVIEKGLEDISSKTTFPVYELLSSPDAPQDQYYHIPIASLYKQLRLGEDYLEAIEKDGFVTDDLSVFHYVEARVLVQTEDYLNSLKQSVSPKIKWIADAAEFGYIFRELATKGYVEHPETKEGKYNASQYTKLLLQHFDIKGTPDSIEKALREKGTLTDKQRITIPYLIDLKKRS